MYQVRLSEEARRAYGNLQTSDLKKVNRGLEIIEQAPIYFPGHIIPLKGPLSGKYRCTVSDWRIIYTLSRMENVVNVEAIVRRKGDTYR